MNELTEFIERNPDPRELKRALAVQMVIQNYTYYAIRDVLKVSVGFITKWRQRYEQQGVAGLHLRHQGSRGQMTLEQRQAVLVWLKQKHYWNLGELQQHLEERYKRNTPTVGLLSFGTEPVIIVRKLSKTI